VASSLLVLVLVVALVPRFSLYGALIALTVAQIGVCGLTLALCLREPSLLRTNWIPAWHPDMARRLLVYSVAALLTAIAVAGSQLVVREIVISTVSAESAGYWQASLRVSEALMITITSVLTSYYLPRLSAAKTDAIVEYVKHFLIVVIPLFALVLAGLYALRTWVIAVLFTSAFAPAERLFAAQFLGDLIRMSGWIFSTVLIARSRMKSVMLAEVCFGASFIAFAAALVPGLHELGANFAYVGAATVSFTANVVAFIGMRHQGRRYTSV
jgi:PST family polysaccharide transporter